MKISFIVIGKNEGFKLVKSIKGIFSFCETNDLRSFEVIYVDSCSVDGSAEAVMAMSEQVRVLRLKGTTNAAIGRNAGAMVASGQVFFFIDGDMELNPAFHIKELSTPDQNILVSGQIENIIYDENYTSVIKREFYYKGLDNDRVERYFGGLFVISRNLWEKAKGMRTEFRYGEDLDLSVRLGAMGYFLKRSSAVLAFHHTVIKPIGFGNVMSNAAYSRGLLYRRHLQNPAILHRILRSDPTMPVLVLCILSFILFHQLFFICSYFLVLCTAIIIKYRFSKNFFTAVLLQFVRDVAVIGAMLFFWPKPQSTGYDILA